MSPRSFSCMPVRPPGRLCRRQCPQRARMCASVHLADPLPGHVGVQLRRADARMSEQLLYDAQVGPALQQVGRERVAQRVRGDPLREPGPRRGRADPLPRALPAAAGPRARRGRPGRRASAPARPLSSRAGRTRAAYRASQSIASSPMGTSRSRSPLPTTRTKPPSSERSSASRPSASLTRSPAAYSSSSSARSRTPAPGGDVHGRRGAAPPPPTVRVSGRCRGCRGRSRRSGDVHRAEPLRVREAVEGRGSPPPPAEARRPEAAPVRSGPPRGRGARSPRPGRGPIGAPRARARTRAGPTRTRGSSPATGRAPP